MCVKARNRLPKHRCPWTAKAQESLGFFRLYSLFNGHIFEFTGFKDIATFLAFHEFRVFLARYNAHARMPAQFLHRYLLGRSFCER